MEGIEPVQQQHPDPATRGERDELEELMATRSRRSQAGTTTSQASDIQTTVLSMASSYHRLNTLTLSADVTPPSLPPSSGQPV